MAPRSDRALLGHTCRSVLLALPERPHARVHDDALVTLALQRHGVDASLRPQPGYGWVFHAHGTAMALQRVYPHGWRGSAGSWQVVTVCDRSVPCPQRLGSW
jgi:hypothetical protein